MSDFMNKKTFEERKSVSDGLYKNNPDWAMSNFLPRPEIAKIYWKWDEEAGHPISMSAEEIATVDAALLEEERYKPKTADQIIKEIGKIWEIHYDAGYYMGFNSINDIPSGTDYEIILNVGWTSDDVVNSEDPVGLAAQLEGLAITEEPTTIIVKVYTTREDSEEIKEQKRQTKLRLINAINSMPVFIQTINSQDWELTREVMDMALANELVTQDDYDWIDSIIPLTK